MGTQGPADVTASEAAARRLVDELAPLGPVESKKMFGGHGLFCESVMFAIVDPRGTAFLRAAGDDGPFRDPSSHKHGRMPYWSVPAGVLEDPDELVRRARVSLDEAVAAKRRATEKKG